LDNDIRRQKQQALITELLERKIRLHARQIYDQRGQAEGSALEDWVQAESEVLGTSILAPLYRKTRMAANAEEFKPAPEVPFGAPDSPCSEGSAS
jgi:hypothetical protein